MRALTPWLIEVLNETPFDWPKPGAENCAPLVDESLGYRPDYHQLKGRELYVQLRGTF